MKTPELLAPAGDWDCVRAAVENGADAIYLGLEKFNARMRAQNFTVTDLPDLMAHLHRRGVKGYVTFNTLVFADELSEAEEYLRAIISAGVDAAIVQDIGICRLIRRLSPDFPIHASTQMTVTSAAGVEFARDLGCNLVVLARECSIKEIGKIQETLAQRAIAPGAASDGTPPPPVQLPLEVFVHGALCVAYSGQCLTSESLGGRSANRGECAQACRMPYDLISDGELVPLGDKQYLLSPQDLAGLDVLPELIQAGVTSLKIEGRLKTPEYVANITQVYRRALDEIFATLEGSDAGTDSQASVAATTQKLAEESRYNLEMGFSRGLYTGWFRGIDNQRLAHARFGKKRGVFLGAVRRIEGQKAVLQLVAPLQPGDGVVFDAGHPDQTEEGGRVYTVETRRDESVISFGHDAVDFRRVHVGDRLWKTSDPELDRRLRSSYAGEQTRYQRPLRLRVDGTAGEPLRLRATDEYENTVELASATLLAPAENQPLTVERLREQLGRLGGTPFKLAELDNHLGANVILPVSELNRLRREVVEKLEAQRITPRGWTFLAPEPQRAYMVPPASTPPSEVTPQLIVLVRNLSQLQSALASGVSLIYCDFENPKHYREAVELYRTTRPATGPRDAVVPGERPIESGLFVAPPRIFKMGEEWILNQVRSCNADGYLVRNYDHLQFFAGQRCVGDFSFNVANAITAEYFIDRFHLERVTASYDLDAGQLAGLLRSAPPHWFEATVHQHMPMFHMEHCVFCAFLSQGTDYTNCGRPCDKHEVRLRDRVGAEHPLKADIGCRNTVFNARAQTGAEYVEQLLALGLRHFRIEFVQETPAQVALTIGKYRQLLAGEISGNKLWRELRLQNQLGVTRGTMERMNAAE